MPASIPRTSSLRATTFGSEAGLANTIAHIDRTIGLDNVPVFHVNDSKAPLGGRVDRHEHVGKGKISEQAFMRILSHPLLRWPPEGSLAEPSYSKRLSTTPAMTAAMCRLVGARGRDKIRRRERGFTMLTQAMRKMKTEIATEGKVRKVMAFSRDQPQKRDQ